MKSGYKFYPDLEKNEASILYIRDNFAFTGGFNIFEEGSRHPEVVTIDLIRKVQKELSVPNEKVLFFGEKKAGFTSIYFGLKYGYQFFSVMPLLNMELHFDGKNEISKERMFGGDEQPKRLISDILAMKAILPGLILQSSYDLSIESYHEELALYFDKEEKISVQNLETQYSAIEIRENRSKVCEEVIHLACLNFFDTNQINNFLLNTKESKVYSNEETFHVNYDNKHRIVKYVEENKESEWLVFAFNPNITLKEKNDVRTGYNYKFLKELPVNVINIRDNFAINGGWYLWEKGDTYPEKIVYQFMEKKRKKLNIQKEKVILFGESKGGFISLYLAKKYGYSHVFAIAPILDPSILLSNKISSVLGLTNNHPNVELEISNKIENQIKTLYKTDENLSGFIWCSDLDDMEGTYLSESFVESIPKIQIRKLENFKFVDTPKVAHSRIASEFLSQIKEKFIELSNH